MLLVTVDLISPWSVQTSPEAQRLHHLSKYMPGPWFGPGGEVDQKEDGAGGWGSMVDPASIGLCGCPRWHGYLGKLLTCGYCGPPGKNAGFRIWVDNC